MSNFSKNSNDFDNFHFCRSITRFDWIQQTRKKHYRLNNRFKRIFVELTTFFLDVINDRVNVEFLINVKIYERLTSWIMMSEINEKEQKKLQNLVRNNLFWCSIFDFNSICKCFSSIIFLKSWFQKNDFSLL